MSTPLVGQLALRLEVVHDHCEHRTRRILRERLRERGPVEQRFPVGRVAHLVVDRRTHRRHLARLVDHCDLDLVRPRRRLDDKGVGTRCRGRVQPVHQVLDRAQAARPVILHLHQPGHRRIDRRDRGNDLRTLAVELVQAARPARRREAAAAAVAVEVVQHVEAGHLEAAAHCLRRRRAVIHAREAHRRRRLQAVVAYVRVRVDRPVVQHAHQPAHGVAGAQRVLHADVRDRIGVLCADRIVQHDQAAVVEVRRRNRLGAARRIGIGRLVQPVHAQRHLPVAPLEVVLLHCQRLWDAHQHPLVPLQVPVDRLRERDCRRRRRSRRAALGDRRDGTELSQAVKLRCRPDDQDVIANSYVAGAGGIHKDAVRSQHITVAGRILQVEPAQSSLEVTNYDAAHRHGLVADRRGIAAPLHLVDRRIGGAGVRRGVVVADRALALAIRDRRACDVRDIDKERLIPLGDDVAVDQDSKGVRRAAGRDGLAGQRGRLIIVVGSSCSSVSGGDVERNTARISRSGETDRE